MLIIIGAFGGVAFQSEMATIYVNPLRGLDSENCHTNASIDNSCATLKYALSKLDKGSWITSIVLADMVHTVNTTITIANVDGLTLTGISNSIIYCEGNSGLRFERVSNLNLSRVQFQNCGSLSQSTSYVNQTSMAVFRVAVYVINTTNITFESVHFVNNRGVGLALFDTNGHVTVMNSNFIGNSVPENERLIYNGGGGLYIEYTYCTPGLMDCDYWNNPYSNNSVYSISGCTFINNHGTTPPQHSSSIFVYQEKTTSRHFGAGGGLLIVIKGNSHSNRIKITDCKFEYNSAGFGGGSLINVQDFVRENIIQFFNCSFVQNHAEFGGGGMAGGILFYELDSVFANEIHFYDTDFLNNSSPTGGGTYYFTGRTKSSELKENSIYFSSCRWLFNNATLGAALLLAPDAFTSLTDGYLPVPVFEDCVFEKNRIVSIEAGSNTKQPAVGALFSSTFTINISSNVTFRENDGTALSITAGSINILENAVLEFEKNTGIRGGALTLLEFASLRLFPGSNIKFVNNHATEVGGAIYASAQDELDFYFSRSCFIHYVDVTVPAKDWKVHVEFINNSAGPTQEAQHNTTQDARGNSIYSVTILPCLLASDTTGEHNIYNAFPHKNGDPFRFVESCHGDFCGIATAPTTLEVKRNQLDSDGILRLSPGERHYVSITAKDDLDNPVSAVITASASPSNVARIDSASLYITDSRVQVNGKIGSNFSLIFHATGRKHISIVLNATFVDCPSGFVYNKEEQQCECSAVTQNRQYLGIIRCSTRSFTSFQSKGYWAGCDENGHLLTAQCPPGYCRKDDNTTFNTNYVPKTCKKLDNVICGVRKRTGLLCGKCIPNHTVFFHSERYDCRECKLGNFGWLFYILSEIIPVTLVFLTVVLFNVHLTAGLWNGVILYAQIIDFIEASSLQAFDPPKGVSVLTNMYRFIYAMFNLDFFKFDDTFSFCLWKGATVMDVLVFKYLTSAYTFLLLLILIFSFKGPCCREKCQTAWERFQAFIRRSHHKDWVIHGISAFLVLSYAQCVKVSFQILSAIELYGEGEVPVKTVVIRSGNIEYLSREHLPYALPAVFILTMTTLPLILLIMYPNGLQLITACFGEKNMEKIEQCCGAPRYSCFQRITRITRFKPIFDSFQGSFKDKYRFFASLFFLYRFIVSLITAVSLNPVSFYASMEIMAILMLGLHAWVQPHEERFYNLLDTFIYVNLATVNALSLLKYYWVNNPTNSNSGTATTIMVIQVILIYLPLVYIVVMWTLLGLTRCSKQARHRFRNINKYVPLYKLSNAEIEEELNNAKAEDRPFDERTLPYRLFDNSESDKEF